jgi:hypothetical protein
MSAGRMNTPFAPRPGRHSRRRWDEFVQPNEPAAGGWLPIAEHHGANYAESRPR